MPSRRLFHLKPKVSPLSPFEWSFFLCQNLAGFDQLFQQDGENFFWLYYADGWRECYRGHREEIDAEWGRRGWSRKQRKFVLTPYLERGIRLKHDIERAERAALRAEYQAAEGWKLEPWEQFLVRMGKPHLLRADEKGEHK